MLEELGHLTCDFRLEIDPQEFDDLMKRCQQANLAVLRLSAGTVTPSEFEEMLDYYQVDPLEYAANLEDNLIVIGA